MEEREISDLVRQLVSQHLAELNETRGSTVRREQSVGYVEIGNVNASEDIGGEAKPIKTSDVYRNTPWASEKSGVIYPSKGRAVISEVGAFDINSGAVWKKGEEPPPANEGDFVERTPSHSQRVETADGKTIYKTNSFTIDVLTPPSVADGRAQTDAVPGEVKIKGRGGSEVTIDSGGNITIKGAATVSIDAGARVSLGTTGLAPLNTNVVRPKDFSKKPIVSGVPAYLQCLTVPGIGGSAKVGADD